MGLSLVKKGALSLEDILSYRQKGLSLAEIARLDGTTKQAISQRIKRSGVDLEGVETFKKDKALLLHAKQRLLLDSLDKKKADKMTGRDLMVSFGIAFDKTQILEGKPTATVANLHLIAERAIRWASENTGIEPEVAVEALPPPMSAIETYRAMIAREKKGVDGETA
jgi:predicted DNA-binding protein YlxM (UPF0122 family)